MNKNHSLPNYALFTHMRSNFNLTLLDGEMEEIKDAIKEDDKIKDIEMIHNPSHYNQQPIECIKVAQLYNYNIGCAIKYLWRCEYKCNKLQDLQKAAKYIQFEIDRDIDVEYWVNFKGTGLSIWFDDLNLKFSDYISSAFYEIYGGYNKTRLLKCLEYINYEIKQIQGS